MVSLNRSLIIPIKLIETFTNVETVKQAQVLRTIASTISLAQIPTPQLWYPFLMINSLSVPTTFVCKSPQDSGSVFVPISLFMSFKGMPITATADQTGTNIYYNRNINKGI